MPLEQTPDLPFKRIGRGKVRDIFDIGQYLLIIATDRVSAFNFELQPVIPGKGIILNQLALYWFEQTKGICANHLPENHTELIAKHLKDFPDLVQRAMIVRKCKVLPIEAIVRFHLTGSAYIEYQHCGSVQAQQLPLGLREFQKLPHPLFTPTEKSDNDRPLTLEEYASLIDEPLASEIHNKSIELATYAAKNAVTKGLILADCKLEYGLDSDNKLTLIDEAFTPDAARFWRKTNLEIDNPKSLDKQIVRDYLLAQDWDRKTTPPTLSSEIVEKVRLRYEEILKIFMPNESA